MLEILNIGIYVLVLIFVGVDNIEIGEIDMFVNFGGVIFFLEDYVYVDLMGIIFLFEVLDLNELEE